jgi:sugar/nucleoside kinase (ribokinase family)
VEDTIGAGDAHAGAIIGCLTNGLSLRDSIAYANQVSRIVVSVKGSSLPPELLPPLPVSKNAR